MQLHEGLRAPLRISSTAAPGGSCTHRSHRSSCKGKVPPVLDIKKDPRGTVKALRVEGECRHAAASRGHMFRHLCCVFA